MLISRVIPLCLILSSGTFFAVLWGAWINALMAGLVLYSIVSDGWRGGGSLSTTGVTIVLFMSILLGVGVVAGFEHGAGDYLVDVCIFIIKALLISILVSNRWKSFKIVDGVFEILYWLVILSLVTMVIRFFLGGSIFPVWQVGGVSTSLIATFYGVDFTESKLFRNSSIFYEPGLFGTYLNLLLMWLLARGGRTRIALTLLATLTTLAPISILIAFLILLVHVNRKFSALRLTLTAVFLFLGSFSMLSMFQGKLTSMSYVLRLQDLKLGFDLSTDYFLLGAGLYNEGFVKEYYLSWVGFERGLSNGFFSLFYQTGVVFSCLYLYFLSKGFSIISNWPIWLCLLFVIFILGMQPVQFSNNFLLFYSIGVLSYGKIGFNRSNSLRVLSPYR